MESESKSKISQVHGQVSQENKDKQPIFIKSEPLVLVVSQSKNEQWEIAGKLEKIGYRGLIQRFDHIDEAKQFLKTVKTA